MVTGSFAAFLKLEPKQNISAEEPKNTDFFLLHQTNKQLHLRSLWRRNAECIIKWKSIEKWSVFSSPYSTVDLH